MSSPNETRNREQSKCLCSKRGEGAKQIRKILVFRVFPRACSKASVNSGYLKGITEPPVMSITLEYTKGCGDYKEIM